LPGKHFYLPPVEIWSLNYRNLTKKCVFITFTFSPGDFQFIPLPHVFIFCNITLKAVLQKNILKSSHKTTYVFYFVGKISSKSNKNWHFCLQLFLCGTHGIYIYIYIFIFNINWTLRMSDNLPERVQILCHTHIIWKVKFWTLTITIQW
jgi:hypothetical protein